MKQDFETNLSDKECRKPTRASIFRRRGQNTQSAVDAIEVNGKIEMIVETDRDETDEKNR